jgi:hypothetical protein
VSLRVEDGEAKAVQTVVLPYIAAGTAGADFVITKLLGLLTLQPDDFT